MRILMFSWKDIKNPAAGGAEVMTWEILKAMVSAGHKVCLFTSRYTQDSNDHEKVDGVEVYRAGGRFGVYFWAVLYYLRFFRGRFDVIVDQVNTVPFFTPLYVTEKKIAFVPQLARELWFYETRFPISIVGYLLEPIFLFLYSKTLTITISRSSEIDLNRNGVRNVKVVPVVSNITPLSVLPALSDDILSVGFVGRMVRGKRALDVLDAFSIIRKEIKVAKLFLLGRGTKQYLKLVEEKINDLGLNGSVKVLSNVSDGERDSVVSRLRVLLVTSVKEGWGLVVTEANSFGVPAVVYNVDGLRDSVKNGVTGIVCQNNTPADLARNVIKIYKDAVLYECLRRNAWEDSKKFTLEKTVGEFISTVVEN
jgi:glycosyltransferase involved in cell wall biosynthesis